MQVGLATEINSMVAGEVDFSQAHVILIGDEMAKTGINQLLEPYYRGKDANITKKVAITKGKAETVLSTEIEKVRLHSLFCRRLRAESMPPTCQMNRLQPYGQNS